MSNKLHNTKQNQRIELTPSHHSPRRKTAHEVLNMISHEEVVAIVRRHSPRANREYLDELAKQLMADAHALVSRRPRRTPAK